MHWWKPRAFLALAAASVALASSACGDDPSEDEEVIPGEFYGVAGHVLREWSAAGKSDLVEQHLNEVEGLDLAFVRSNWDWPGLEPTAPEAGRRSYRWSSHDPWVRSLARHRLRWYLVAFGTPRWAGDPAALAAGCGIFAPPRENADFVAALRAMAERYGRDGSFWEENPDLPYRPVTDYEIWNEPNLGSAWCPSPDPSRYAALFWEATAAIKEVDPDATIILGGLAPFTEDRAATADVRVATAAGPFINAVANEPSPDENSIDVIGVHAYGDPATMSSLIEYFRSSADSAGLSSADLSVNELGWPTAGVGSFANVPEATRATWIRDMTEAIATSDCGVLSFAPHTWVTPEADPNDQEDWFGMANPVSGEPYPSAEELGEVVDTLPPGEPTGEARLCAGDSAAD